MRQGMEYLVSFEVVGQRKFDRKNAYSITEVIQRVRRVYPDACMFRVLKKQVVPDLVGGPNLKAV